MSLMVGSPAFWTEDRKRSKLIIPTRGSIAANLMALNGFASVTACPSSLQIPKYHVPINCFHVYSRITSNKIS